MKKLKLLMLLGAVSFSSSAMATKSFDGFYVGAEAGYMQRSVDSKTDVKVNTNIPGFNPSGSASKTTGQKGFLYGAIAGYGLTMDSVYFGAELGVKKDTAHKSNNYVIELKHPMLAAAGEKLSAKRLGQYKRGVVFSIAPRIGYVFLDSNLIYAKLGIEGSRDSVLLTEVEAKDGVNDVILNKKKWKVAFVPGIGIERSFGAVHLRAEYGYNIGSSFSGSFKDSGQFDDGSNWNSIENGKLGYKSHEVKLGVVYKF